MHPRVSAVSSLSGGQAEIDREDYRLLSVIGILFYLAYRLRRHLWTAWPLSRWLGLVPLVAALAMLRRWPVSAVLVGVWLVYVALLAWAGWRAHVHFEAAPPGEVLDLEANPVVPLRVDEMVPVRASGVFTVEGKVQTYMDLEARFQTVETREHIVLAQVRPSRFLLLGRWPEFELGWWYIFFQPATVRALQTGHLHFGLHPCPAIQVVYALDEETQATAYLASPDSRTLRRIWDDLGKDMPSGATPADGDSSRTRDRKPLD